MWFRVAIPGLSIGSPSLGTASCAAAKQERRQSPGQPGPLPAGDQERLGELRDHRTGFTKVAVVLKVFEENLHSVTHNHATFIVEIDTQAVPDRKAL